MKTDAFQDRLEMNPPLPLPDQSFGITELMSGPASQSWVVKCVNLVFESDVTPGIDVVALLEGPDGVLNELRVIVGIAKDADTLGVVQPGAAPCRLSVLWNKAEVVNRVLLTFRSHTSLASFLLHLVTAFTHLEENAAKIADEVNEKGGEA